MRHITFLIALALFAMSTGGAAQAGPKPGDDRAVFATSGGVFEYLGGDKWIEKRYGAPDSRFTEVLRSASYVELYDADRDMGVRLYATYGVWYHAPSGKWVKWPGSDGKWKK